MAPKKKGRANKLARMTEEEKLRYLQHKAAMEEEAQRRKQELILTFMKTKTMHEECFTRLNSAKINQQWRKILRQIKCKELKEDMETMKQRFEVSLECKNKVIDNLLTDFDDAEMQYSLQYQTQMEVILKLLDIQRSRFSDLQTWYNNQVQELIEQDATERKTFKEELQQQMQKLQDMYDRSKQTSVTRTEELQSKFNASKNEIQTKLLYTLVKMEEKYSDEIRKMKNQCEELSQQHSQNTDTKKAHYNILSAKDDADTATVANNFEELAKLKRDVTSTKEKYTKMMESKKRAVQSLKTEKDNLKKAQIKLKEENEQVLTKDEEQLKLLTEISNHQIKDLKTIFKKGVALLHLIDICRKYQKKPFNITIQKIQTAREQNEEISSDFFHTKFNLFWEEYGEIALKTDNLKKKRNEVTAENEKLKKLLQLYINSVRRSSSVPRKCGF